MSSEWPIVEIEQVCELIVDCVNKTAPVVAEKTPYRMIRTTNIRNGRVNLDGCRYVDQPTFDKWTRRAKLKFGDVVLTREAPIGEVGFVNDPENLFLGQRVMQYRANPNVLAPRFLLYTFLSPALQHQFGSHEGSGSVVSHIRVGDCFKFKMSLPPLSVQTEIATILGALDDRISLLRETNTTLEAISQALFKSWFVDFDPVHSKQQGREPDGMDEATAALFPDSFEELVPKGWRVGSLKEFCTLTSGKRPVVRSDNQTNEASIPLYGGAGIMGFTSESLYQETKILTGRVGTLGNVHLVNPPFWASDNVLVLTPLNKRNLLFCLHWVSGIDVHALNRGSTQPLLTQKDLGNQASVLPTENLLDLFTEVSSSIYVKIEDNRNRIATLITIRDTLLPRLISGQLRLPEAETMLEEACA